MARSTEIIGLIPCGGHATRISPLPCSKELLPVALRRTEDGSLRPKVAAHDLLEQMRESGATKAFFILRKGKWDIPAYFGSGGSFGVNLGYLLTDVPYGPPYTLDQAYSFVRGARIVFGFPDILFGPPDALRRAIKRLASTRADLVLGLYRPHDIRAADMVAVDRTGRVREMILKPEETKLKWDWTFAVWAPAFTEFLHDYLSVPRTVGQKPGAALPTELTVGHVIQAAIREGLRTQSVAFSKHNYLDIGTSEGLQRVGLDLRSEYL